MMITYEDTDVRVNFPDCNVRVTSDREVRIYRANGNWDVYERVADLHPGEVTIGRMICTIWRS